jgi:hypothetical protein
MNRSILRKKQYIDNPAESFKEIGKALGGSLASDLGKGIASDAGKQWEQLLGIKKGNREASGDLVEGEELYLEQAEKVAKLDIEPGINYRREILHGYKKITQEDNQEISNKIQEIIIELK